MEFVQEFISPAVWAGAILALLLQYIIKHLPKGFKAWVRGARFKQMKKIKIMRHSQDQVTFQSMKANSYYLVFIGLCALYLMFFTMGPLNSLKQFPLWISLIVMSPIFVMEILWLNQSGLAVKLIKYRKKLRVKNRIHH